MKADLDDEESLVAAMSGAYGEQRARNLFVSFLISFLNYYLLLKIAIMVSTFW